MTDVSQNPYAKFKDGCIQLVRQYGGYLGLDFIPIGETDDITHLLYDTSVADYLKEVITVDCNGKVTLWVKGEKDKWLPHVSADVLDLDLAEVSGVMSETTEGTQSRRILAKFHDGSGQTSSHRFNI